MMPPMAAPVLRPAWRPAARAASLAVVLLAPVVLAAPARAQGAGGEAHDTLPRWELLPGESRSDVVNAADPKPTAMGTHLGRGTGTFGTRWLWQANMGGDAVLARRTGAARDGGTPRVVEFGVRGAVAALFELGTGNRGLMSSDFHIAVPLSLLLGDWAIAVGPRHESSHLANEYGQRTGLPPTYVSHNYLAAQLAWRGGGARFYVSGQALGRQRLGMHVPGERAGGGVEYETRVRRLPLGVGARGFLALDEQRMRAAGWARSTTAVAGLEVARAAHGASGPRLRVQLSAHEGASPYWQFHRHGMRWIGLGTTLLR